MRFLYFLCLTVLSLVSYSHAASSTAYLQAVSALEAEVAAANTAHAGVDSLLESAAQHVAAAYSTSDDDSLGAEVLEAGNALSRDDNDKHTGHSPFFYGGEPHDVLSPIEHQTAKPTVDPNSAATIFAEMNKEQEGMENPLFERPVTEDKYETPRAPPPTYFKTFLFDFNAPWRQDSPAPTKTHAASLIQLPYHPLREVQPDGHYIQRAPEQFSPGSSFEGLTSENFYTPGFLPRNPDNPSMADQGDGPAFTVDANGNPEPLRPAMKVPISQYDTSLRPGASFVEVESEVEFPQNNALWTPGPAEARSDNNAKEDPFTPLAAAELKRIGSFSKLKKSYRLSLHPEEYTSEALSLLQKEQDAKSHQLENEKAAFGISPHKAAHATLMETRSTQAKPTKKAWWEHNEGKTRNELNRMISTTAQKLANVPSHHSGAYELEAGSLAKAPEHAEQLLDMAAVEMKSKSRAATRLASKLKSKTTFQPYAKGSISFDPTTNDSKFTFIPAGFRVVRPPLPPSHPASKENIPAWAPESHQPTPGAGFYGSSAAIIPGSEAFFPGAEGKEYSIRAREAWTQHAAAQAQEPSKQIPFPPYAFVPPIEAKSDEGGRPDIFPTRQFLPYSSAHRSLQRAGLTNTQLGLFPASALNRAAGSLLTRIPRAVPAQNMQAQAFYPGQPLQPIVTQPVAYYPTLPANFGQQQVYPTQALPGPVVRYV